ncbi:MAG: ORF6N domain-containing protein [Elusimicrobia bacterium]|nr:ORF6N domain-containing protein [Elusimicrobiota bacterium]
MASKRSACRKFGKIPDPLESIEQRALLVRSHWVLLDTDAAKFYQVQPRTLRAAVSKNIDRFAKEFIFRLSKQDAQELPKTGVKRPTPIYAFTMTGIAMLSSVLNSKKAAQTSINIIRYRIVNRRRFVELGGYDGLPDSSRGLS